MSIWTTRYSECDFFLLSIVEVISSLGSQQSSKSQKKLYVRVGCDRGGEYHRSKTTRNNR